jgi:O-antigen/teichoic acid export membrane protein
VERQLQRARRQLADPLTANGYALIANSGATGALGLVYWLFMARLYPTAAVGRASALYAAMNLLAGITAQSFNGALNRFIPHAGLRTRSFIIRAYTVSAAASIILAILFVLTAGWWGTSYSELNGPVIGAVFVCSVVAWAIFTLQDSVLVGLRAARWVLVENGLFGVVKLLLLVALVAVFPFHLGIYVSWMVPAVVALPLINLLIFGHLVPRHALLTCDFQPASNRQIGRFLAGDYSGGLCMLATGSLIPVVVASSIGARQTAYFYIAWVIVGIVDMIGISMAMSLTVEGAFDAATLASNCRAALRKMTAVLVPCAVLLAVFAPVWLRLFGPAYAAQGTAVLRLLAVATVCRAPTELYLGVLRAESRTSLIALVQALRAALMLGLTVALTGTMGTLGAGVAVAATQAVAAILIAPGLWRVLRADHGRRIRTTPGLVR